MAGPPIRADDRPRSLGRRGGRPSAGFAVAAYERAIHAAGNSTFGRDFTRFAADVSEWRTGIGFRESYLYPDMPRQGTLRLGTPAATRKLNHATFSLIAVHARRGRALEVQVEAPEGVAAGLALVGRVGSERHGHTVKAIDYSEAGGELVATLPDPGHFQRITAVLVDADTAARHFSTHHLDWRYQEAEPFRISGRVLRSARAERRRTVAYALGAAAPLLAAALTFRGARRRGGERLLGRCLEVELEARQVGHHVVVADQAEVHLAVVVHDPDADRLFLRQRHHREDRLHPPAEHREERELRARTSVTTRCKNRWARLQARSLRDDRRRREVGQVGGSWRHRLPGHSSGPWTGDDLQAPTGSSAPDRKRRHHRLIRLPSGRVLDLAGSRPEPSPTGSSPGSWPGLAR